MTYSTVHLERFANTKIGQDERLTVQDERCINSKIVQDDWWTMTVYVQYDLKAEREKMGLSQDDLSALLGLSLSTYRRAEKDKKYGCERIYMLAMEGLKNVRKN